MRFLRLLPCAGRMRHMTKQIVSVKDQVQKALALHAAGITLPDAAMQCGIDVRIVYDLARRDSIVHDTMISAGEACAAHLVRESLDIADKDVDPQRARVRVGARQWAASRMDRARWGDKMEIKVEQTVSIAAALEAANARLQPISDQKPVIDLEVTDVAQVITREPPDSKSVADTRDLPNPFD